MADTTNKEPKAETWDEKTARLNKEYAEAQAKYGKTSWMDNTIAKIKELITKKNTKAKSKKAMKKVEELREQKKIASSTPKRVIGHLN
jgi:hypothetical protein